MRVFGVSGLIGVYAPGDPPLKSFRSAPNAKLLPNGDIKMLSHGDDRGYVGERHGRSTVTTRVENLDACAPIFQHKAAACAAFAESSPRHRVPEAAGAFVPDTSKLTITEQRMALSEQRSRL